MSKKLAIKEFHSFKDGIAILSFVPQIALIYFHNKEFINKLEEINKDQDLLMEEMFDIKNWSKKRAEELSQDDESFDKDFDKAFEKIVRICAKPRIRNKKIKVNLIGENVIFRVLD